MRLCQVFALYLLDEIRYTFFHFKSLQRNVEMPTFRISQVLLTTSLLVSNYAFAAAFQFYELGTPIIGTAGVGQAALAEDASTAYFNPAGMAALQGTQFMVGSEVIVPYAHFKA